MSFMNYCICLQLCRNKKGKATGFLVVAQVIFVLLFGLFVEYENLPTTALNETSETPYGLQLNQIYPSN